MKLRIIKKGGSFVGQRQCLGLFWFDVTWRHNRAEPIEAALAGYVEERQPTEVVKEWDTEYRGSIDV